VRYEVTKNGRKVLLFRDQPGVLLSTAARPPGFKPPNHPFLDAQALDSGYEPELGALLQSCSSAADFIAALKRLGYEVSTGDVA
jgi:hypothetical protein